MERVIERMHGAAKILITTHTNPDGDGIGSEIALGEALIGLGKTVDIINDDEIPERFRFLDTHRRIQVFEPDKCLAERGHDLAIIVDANALSRIGKIGEALGAMDVHKLFIDHHPLEESNPEFYLIDASASSVGQILFHVFDKMGVTLTRHISECLYAAILYDTFSFRFIRNEPEPLDIAARLVRNGADADRIYNAIFGTKTKGKVSLMAHCLSHLQYEYGGKLCHITIDNALIERIGASLDDLRDITNLLLDIEGVKVSVVFKQRKNGEFKISFRSRKPVNVNRVAMQFGGGGHENASGATVRMSLEEARPAVIGAFKELL